MIQVLILEDELKAGEELKALVETLRPDMEVCAVLQSVAEAIAWFAGNLPPALILSDIQLADGPCFGLFKGVKVQAPVIFCTAYDQYAMAAFEANGIDYLLKPVDKTRLEKSLLKFDQLRELFARESSGYYQRLAGLAAQIGRQYAGSLLAYFQNKIIPVRTEEISFIHTREEKTQVYCGNVPYVIQESLDELTVKLDPADFYRANRQYILHRRSIASIEQLFGRKLLVRLTVPTPETIIISKGKAQDFLRWLQGA